jgi:phage nucleotide-binding protein
MPNLTPQTVLRQATRNYSFRSLRVLDASEIMTSQGAIMILYGPAGAGKTTTAAKVALNPLFAPAVIFDAEAGSKVVSHMKDIVKVYPVRQWQEIDMVVDTIVNAPNTDELVYKTFIFDNMTEIQDICLRHHMSIDSRGPQEWPELQHHGRVKLDIIEMVRKLRDAAEKKRIVIILCAWEKPEEDKQGNVLKHEINFIPSLTASLPGMVDYIGWLNIQGYGTRELNFASANTSSAKFRRPIEGPTTEIPLKFKVGIRDNPLGDVLGTLIGGVPWPKAKYNPVSSQTPTPQLIKTREGESN